MLDAFAIVEAALADAADANPMVLASDRHLETLLRKRAGTLHIGPANFCWFSDPTKALCLHLAGTPEATRPLAGMCDSARCPQATHHPCYRPVWADQATQTQVLLGNPRAQGRENPLAPELDRALRVLAEIDADTRPEDPDVPLSDQDWTRNEAAIRAAMEQLLSGSPPEGGRCDLRTLAAMAGVPRTGFYPKKDRHGVHRAGTYQHLAVEFDRRRAALLAVGVVVDPRAAQIDRFKDEVTVLRSRVASRDEEIAELTEFKTMADSRLAARHEEIQRLRQLLRDRDGPAGVRVLASAHAEGGVGRPPSD